MPSHIRPFIHLFHSSPCLQAPEGCSGHKPCRIHLCFQTWAPGHPAASRTQERGSTRARSTSSPSMGSLHTITVLTAPKTPTSPSTLEAGIFLHISQNSTGGQSLPRLFLPSGQKSQAGTALQRSNPSQCDEYSPKNVDLEVGFSAKLLFPRRGVGMA